MSLLSCMGCTETYNQWLSWNLDYPWYGNFHGHVSCKETSRTNTMCHFGKWHVSSRGNNNSHSNFLNFTHENLWVTMHGVPRVCDWTVLYDFITYPTYFEIDSTFLVLWTRLIWVCLTLILYHYTTNNDCAWYNIWSVWFLDIGISTCLQRCKRFMHNCT